MIQKAIKVGTSIAVTLPKKALAELGIKAGDSLAVSVDTKSRRVSIEPHAPVDSDTLEWARKFMKRYDAALKALAK